MIDFKVNTSFAPVTFPFAPSAAVFPVLLGLYSNAVELFVAILSGLPSLVTRVFSLLNYHKLPDVPK